ncbi:MAG: (d)CMP kinase [Acidimicrobiales bacterium]
MTVAIDGPGGAGKSTIAAALAARLGLERLDSGAMYRALALAAIRRGVGLSDGDSLGELAVAIRLRVSGSVVELDGEDVSAAIRTPAVTRVASLVAAYPAVRVELVARQRAWVAERRGGVVEGRDIGSVVCPEAELKVYLTAEVAERARRRTAEMGPGSGTQTVAAELAKRDIHDSTRLDSPLEVVPGAVVIDTTNRTVPELVEEIVGLLADVVGGGCAG